MRIKGIVMTIGICVMTASLLALVFTPPFWLVVADAVIAIILLAITCVSLEKKQQA